MREVRSGNTDRTMAGIIVAVLVLAFMGGLLALDRRSRRRGRRGGSC